MAQEFFLYYDDLATVFDHTQGAKITFDADGIALLALMNKAASPTKKLQRKTNPGVSEIIVAIEDSSPGSGHEEGEIKLATTLAGLDTAVAGADLSLGTTINPGEAQRANIYIKATDLTGGGVTSSELKLTINNCAEVPV